MLPYQQRVVDEYNALLEKIEALNTFLLSDKIDSLPDMDAVLLLGQQGAMVTYASFLNLRISSFK